METRRIFYEDAYRTGFSARVEEVRQEGEALWVRLSQTAFYPEGGGQGCDQGSLGEALVSDVQEKDGEIWHRVSTPLSVGERVEGKINWQRRFDLMQQHSGEHIVSGLIHQSYGYDNVGFHMGEDVVTIDFSGVLTLEQLGEIEERANALIAQNLETEIFYPSPEGLDVLTYRSKKALEGEVRIVRFPGADTCACCGLHVKHTGEIQMVRILSVVKFHQGVRVEMISGHRVLSYLRAVDGQNHQISVSLSASPMETAAAVERLKEECFALRGRVKGLLLSQMDARAASYAGAGDVLLFEEEMDADTVRRLCDKVMDSCGGRCAVFSQSPDGSFKYAIGEKGGDLRSFTKSLNQALMGRGGGKPFFVQGSVGASREEIEAFWSAQLEERGSR